MYFDQRTALALSKCHSERGEESFQSSFPEVNLKQNKIYIIDILKAAATVMIFCYHCNSLLPGEWKWITVFGDTLGNNLFFLISGFSLFPSIRSADLKDFPGWYLRRIKRILPLLLLFYLLSYLTGFYSLEPSGLFTVFIYPSLYWFVTGILFFYIILFFMGKLLPVKSLPLFCLLLIFLWLINPLKMESYYYIGFAFMLIGFMIRGILKNGSDEEMLPVPDGRVTISCVILSLAGLGLFLLLKFRMPSALSETGVIRLLFGISIILSLIPPLILGAAHNENLKCFFEAKPKLYSFLHLTGNLALPVYMIQCFNAGMPGYLIGQRIVFPLSFALNFIIVFGGALILENLRLLIEKRNLLKE